jgi:hypothetical protein
MSWSDRSKGMQIIQNTTDLNFEKGEVTELLRPYD